MLYTYDVDIEATSEAPKDTTQATRIPDMPFKATQENLNSKSTIVPKINLTKDLIQSFIVLYNKTTNQKQVLEAYRKIYKKNNKVFLKLQKLPVYSNLKTGEWYLMAFIGGGQKSGDNLQVTTNTTLEPMKNGNSFTASCPFATPWRRVVLKGSKLELNAPNTEMVFKPQGVFLVLNIENRMTLDVKLNRDVRMESNAFCSSGTYDFNINQNTIADNADLAFDYWTPDESKAITGNTAAYTKYNAKHYFTNFKLKYNANVNDGSNRSRQSDLGDYLYFNKKNKGANPQTASSYVLCVMPVNYKKTSDYAGAETQVLFYGKVSTTDPTRTQYTYNADIYYNEQNPNPNTWRPYMEGRYILGSTAKKLDTGKSYDMTLRIIRPMLPIERLWAARQSNNMQQLGRGIAERIAEGEDSNGGYKNLQYKYYRFPKTSEFVPIFNNPKKQLETGEKIGGIGRSYIGAEYGNAMTTQVKYDYADINGKQNKFNNWFCSVQGSNIMYGIMYIRSFNGRDKEATDNYRVAVRITFPSANPSSGIAVISTYYLGPNYNLSVNTMGYHCCHPDFWRKLDGDKDVISRWFQLGLYWLNNKETHQSSEPRRLLDYFNTDGIGLGDGPHTKLVQNTSNCYFLPWLKTPAW